MLVDDCYPTATWFEEDISKKRSLTLRCTSDTVVPQVPVTQLVQEAVTRGDTELFKLPNVSMQSVALGKQRTTCQLGHAHLTGHAPWKLQNFIDEAASIWAITNMRDDLRNVICTVQLPAIVSLRSKSTSDVEAMQKVCEEFMDAVCEEVGQLATAPCKCLCDACRRFPYPVLHVTDDGVTAQWRSLECEPRDQHHLNAHLKLGSILVRNESIEWAPGAKVDSESDKF